MAKGKDAAGTGSGVANDQRERVRLVINHRDVKAALRDGRLEGVRRDKRLQGGARLEDELAAFAP